MWQLHDDGIHEADKWQDMQGSFRDADSVARVYLKDLDPTDYDAARTFTLLVRRSAADAAQKVVIGIRPIAWIVNGRT